jgi:hypothetical protein
MREWIEAVRQNHERGHLNRKLRQVTYRRAWFLGIKKVEPGDQQDVSSKVEGRTTLSETSETDVLQWSFFGSDIGAPRQPNLIHASDDAFEHLDRDSAKKRRHRCGRQRAAHLDGSWRDRRRAAWRRTICHVGVRQSGLPQCGRPLAGGSRCGALSTLCQSVSERSSRPCARKRVSRVSQNPGSRCDVPPVRITPRATIQRMIQCGSVELLRAILKLAAWNVESPQKDSC